MGIIIHNDIIYNSGGNNIKPIQYDVGDFFGDASAEKIDSLSVTLSNHIGQTAILIIMHRDTAITISSDWTLVDKHDVVYAETATQSISIYKKKVENSSESYTIQQATTDRMCACIYYFKDDPQLEWDESLEYMSTNPYTFNVSKKDYYRLIVSNNVYAGGTSTITTSPSVVINTKGNSSLPIRLMSLINPCSSDLTVTFDTGLNLESDRIFCYKINSASVDKGVPLFTDAEWEDLPLIQKQSHGLTAIQNRETGYKRGVLVYGADATDTYLPNSNTNNIICEAYPNLFNPSDSTWGKGSNPIQFSNGTPTLDAADNAISLTVASTGILGYVDLGANSTPFTAYVVMKATNPTQYSRLISSMSERSIGNGIMLYGNTINVSSWASDTSTGISSTEYFVGAIQYSGSGALGIVYGGNIINKSPVSAGRYITLGRTDIDSSGTNAEPCDLLIKYVGIVNEAEDNTIIQNNLQNLYNIFYGEQTGKIFYGTSAPNQSQGSNGDYYYIRTNDSSINGINWDSESTFSSSQQTHAGWEFYPNSNITVVGLKVRNRNNTDATGYLLLGDTNGNIIAQTEQSTFLAQGWTEILLDTPINLSNSTHYIVQVVFTGSGYMSYKNRSSIIPSDKITYVQGRYSSFPGTQESDILYGCDIMIKNDYYYITDQYIKENGMWNKIM